MDVNRSKTVEHLLSVAACPFGSRPQFGLLARGPNRALARGQLADPYKTVIKTSNELLKHSLKRSRFDIQHNPVIDEGSL